MPIAAARTCRVFASINHIQLHAAVGLWPCCWFWPIPTSSAAAFASLLAFATEKQKQREGAEDGGRCDWAALWHWYCVCVCVCLHATIWGTLRFELPLTGTAAAYSSAKCLHDCLHNSLLIAGQISCRLERVTAYASCGAMPAHTYVRAASKQECTKERNRDRERERDGVWHVSYVRGLSHGAYA